MFSFYLLVITVYLVHTSGYLVVTSGYLIATTRYFSLLLVTSRYFWFLVLVTTVIISLSLETKKKIIYLAIAKDCWVIKLGELVVLFTILWLKWSVKKHCVAKILLATIIPQDLVTNLFLSSFYPFLQTKDKNLAFNKLVVC